MLPIEEVWDKFYGFKSDIPCKNNLDGKMKTLPREFALKTKYLQTNHSDWINIIVVDMDLEDAGELLRQKVKEGFPTPNIAVMNPSTKHIHAIWLLKKGVSKKNASDRQALNIIQKKLNYVFGGDTNYTRFIFRNPFYVTHFTKLLKDSAYLPSDLFEKLQKVEMTIVEESLEDVGRNTFLFDQVRKMTHSKFRYVETKHELFEYAMEQAELINNSFDTPLPFSEVKATVWSTVSWTWEHFSNKNYVNGLREKQAQRMERIQSGDYSREPKLREKKLRRKKMWEYRQKNWTYQEIADKLGITFREVANGINYSKRKHEFETENNKS